MKVIFLDVDGVLNSFDLIKETSQNGHVEFVDPKSVAVLKKIVDATDAKIVLSSSWRSGWHKEKEKCDPICLTLFEMLEENNMPVYDVTEISEGFTPRYIEIKNWLNNHEVESYLILDDNDFDWKKAHMEKRWVKTDVEHYGLKESDYDKCVQILDTKLSLIEKVF